MGQHGEEVRCISDSLNMMRLPLEVSPFNPQSLTGQPRWGIGDRIPLTPCVASHCVRYSFHPQSLRDSPGGALGTVFPKPLASLRSEFVVLHYYYYI